MTPVIAQTDRPAASMMWDTDSARRDSAALARWITLGSLGLLACLWLGVVLSAWSVREAALDRATSAAGNLSAAFCEQVTHTLSTVSAAMDLTARRLRADPAGFRLEHWAEEVDRKSVV